MGVRVRILLLASGLVLYPSLVFSQVGNASLGGTVRDTSGAVIPGAQVVVTNNATGVATHFRTTSAGRYLATNLIPGTYSVTVTGRGFKATVISNIVLRVDQQAHVDVTLIIGSMVQQVTVSGSGMALLQTQNASVGTVVDHSQVVNLPLNGRFFTQMLELTPGSVPPAPQGQTSNYIATTQRNQQPAFDMNGQPGAYTMFTIDGIDNSEHNFGGSAIPLSIDAIGQFKVLTADFSAQYGRSPVQVDVVSRSGTDQFHGDAYEFVRNDAFSSEQWSFTGPHQPLNLKRNNFGATFGGPIKQDKLFFFGSYDGTRLVSVEPSTTTVPSNAMRSGTFPAGEVIFDPVTGQPFTGNSVPQSDWNPISAKILSSVLPPPNLPGVPVTNAAGLALPPINNYLLNPAFNQTINQYSGRIDYTLSPKDNFFGRYTYSSNNIFAGVGTSGGVGGVVGAQIENFGAQNLGVGWTHSFSPTTINQVLFGLLVNPDRYNKVVNAQTPSFSTLGLAPFLAPNAYPGLPSIHIGSVELSSGDYRPLQYGDDDFIGYDNATLVRGKHTIEFGAAIQRTVLQEADGEVSDGRFYFNGAQTRNRVTPTSPTTPCLSGPGVCDSGDAMADFLLGDLSESSRGTPIPMMQKYFSVWAGYAEDTWQIRPNFTLNAGLRYSYTTAFHVGGDHADFYSQPIIVHGLLTGKVALANNSSGNVDTADQIPAVLAAYPGVFESCRAAGLPDNCQYSEKYDWQPRVGFAWQARRNTVLRGGYGIFYGFLEGYVQTEQGDSFPFVQFVYTPTFTTPPAPGQPPPLSFSNPFALTTATAPAFNNNGAPFRPLPATYDWNLTIEQALSPSTTLSVGYVASVSRHLEDAANNQGYCCWVNIPGPVGEVLGPNQALQPPDPQFGPVTTYGDNGNASYESLQASLEHRVHNVTFSADYTYSKNLYTQPGLTDILNFNIDRGPFDDNVTHNFVFSAVWQVPFGAGQRWGSHLSAPLDAVLGGWQAGPIIDIRSGYPFTPTLSGTDLLDQSGFNDFDSPDRVPGCNVYSNQSLGNWYNKNCFTMPVEPTTPGAKLLPGNAGIEELTGPGGWSADLGVSKFFRLSERFRLEFRGEAFNIFNHPLFGQPDTTIVPGANVPAVISSVISQPRIIQLALKLHF
jgi:hypothetical protein